MMRSAAISVAAAISTALVSLPTAAQNRLTLEPASDWVLDYAEGSCALQRQFGSEGERVLLELRQFGPDVGFEAAIASPDFELASGELEVTVEPVDNEPRQLILAYDIALSNGYRGKAFSLTPLPTWDELEAAREEFVQSTTILSSEDKDLLGRVDELAVGSHEWERLVVSARYRVAAERAGFAFRRSDAFPNLRSTSERSVAGIHIKNLFNQDIFLQTGDLYSPMNSMRSCLDDLLADWGIEAATDRQLTRPVEPDDFEAWSRGLSQYIPFDMLSGRGPSQFVAWLAVSAEGDVTDCKLHTRFENERFRRRSCNNLMRATFNPALDAQGQPVDSYYIMLLRG